MPLPNIRLQGRLGTRVHQRAVFIFAFQRTPVAPCSGSRRPSQSLRSRSRKLVATLPLTAAGVGGALPAGQMGLVGPHD